MSLGAGTFHQAVHIALMISNFSEDIEMVKLTVSITMPRQGTCVLGGTSFLLFTVSPCSASNLCNLMYVWLILEGREIHKKSSI